MKATDLMIGDWVLIPDHQYAPATNPARITMVNEFNALTVFCDGGDPIFNGEEVEPIPLTPEILEKNGIKLFSVYTHPYRDGGWEEGELEEAMKHYPMYVYQTLNPYITFVSRPNEQELKVCSSNYKTRVERVEKKEETIFVHELQHVLKLCGIEKEIVL